MNGRTATKQNAVVTHKAQVSYKSGNAHNGSMTLNKGTSLRLKLNKIFLMTLLSLPSSAVVMVTVRLQSDLRCRLCREVSGTSGGQKSEDQSLQQLQSRGGN